MKMRSCAAVMLVITLLLSLASPALAASAQVDSLEEFLADGSEQFTLGVDSNFYTHSYESFGDTYALDDAYMQKLIDLEPTNSGKLNILRFRQDSEWGGSCYGIASTMLLNRLTKDGNADENGELHIEKFQPGAEDYFDLGIPAELPEVRNMINYYMTSQLLSWTNRHTTALAVVSYEDLGLVDEENNFTAFDENGDPLLTELGYFAPNAQYFINLVKSYVDNGEPFLFCYFCALGGHAILGIDYFEDDNGTPGDPGDDIFYLKTFDENNVMEDGDADPNWSYLEIRKNEDGQYDATTAALYYCYDDTGVYESIGDLFLLEIIDMGAMNSNLNVENPVSPEFEISYNPMMYLSDLGRIADGIAVKVDSEVYGTEITFKNNDGLFIPEYSAPNGKDALRYIDYETAIQNSVDAILSLNEADGFVLTNENEGVVDLIMLSESEDEASTYSGVAGANFAEVSFDGEGQFQRITAQEGKKIEDLDIYVGTLGDELSTDMFSLYMPECTYLEMYDWLDDYSFGDAIVLHSDGFTSGMDLWFYDGLTVIEEPLQVISDDENDRWVKIMVDYYGDTNFITIWSAFEAAEGESPVFNDLPDMVGWVGENPPDGWVILESGINMYFENGEPVTGAKTVAVEIEEHHYIFDENGYMITGAVDTKDGYTYYEEAGISPVLDELGQLQYVMSQTKDGLVYTLKDWVYGDFVAVSDDVVGGFFVMDGEEEGTMSISVDGEEFFTVTPDENGNFPIVLEGDPFADDAAEPIELTLVVEPNNRSISDIFSDVSPRDWFADAVTFVYQADVMEGDGNGRFLPMDNITRGMVVATLHRMAGEEPASEDFVMTFADVPDDAYYAEAVAWAAENGIVAGYSATTFAPEDTINREQLVTILYRMLSNYFEIDLGLEVDLSDFEDSGEVSDWAVEAMNWAAALDGLHIEEDGLLMPKTGAVRAECALGLEALTTSIFYSLFM